MEKNIIVTDSSGRILGLTYLKRANGMVKNGRAEFVKENEIRLSDVTHSKDLRSSELMEDNKMSDIEKKETSVNADGKDKIYFNAREWNVCSDQSVSKGERTFVTDFENGLSEAYCIGDKTQNITEIGTKQLVLEKNTKYTFYFWLKTERSLRYDAVCQLQIIYNGDFENKRVYMLSNGNIRSLKTIDGWQLYEIPFVTEDNEYTQLRFSVKYASCSIIPGKEAKYYSSLPDDEVFDDGKYDEPDEETNDNDPSNPFKNISNSFKEFFGQFDTSQNGKNPNTDTKQNNTTGNDPFAAFNEFARQVKRDVQREVNRSVRSDIYNDIRAMKDEIVSELKNTFGNNNNSNK